MANAWSPLLPSPPNSPQIPSRRTPKLLPGRGGGGGAGSHIRRHRRGNLLSARSLSDDNASSSQQQVELSVLRFTLGIPGLDETYLPRYLGVLFGSLLVLNHFVDASPHTPAQLTTEALGICLASFSAMLPYIGKFLKGANPVNRSLLPQGNTQIFAITEDLAENLKEDLAWESFVLLNNTNTMSVIISVQDSLCIRGYWNMREGTSKADIINWFQKQIEDTGLTEIRDALYFPQLTDQLWGILPNGATSVLLQPLLGTSNENEKTKGFILLVSHASYAYRDRDRAWIKCIAQKNEAFHIPCGSSISEQKN